MMFQDKGFSSRGIPGSSNYGLKDIPGMASYVAISPSSSLSKTSQNRTFNAGGYAGVSASSSASSPPSYEFKLVLLGETSVGKSCLVVKFAKGEFPVNQEATIGAAFVTQSVDLGNQYVKFEIWDTAGQERYRTLAPMYYRGAAAAVIVYDITNKDSFNKSKSWIEELYNIRGSEIVIALAGNKVDLEADRAVDTEVARQYAKENGIIFLETSAKTGFNVLELFKAIAQRIPKHKKEQDPLVGFQINKQGAQEPSRSWCCM